MDNSIKFLVKNENNNERLDIFLTKKINNLTRAKIKKIIESHNVTINEKKFSLPSKK